MRDAGGGGFVISAWLDDRGPRASSDRRRTSSESRLAHVESTHTIGELRTSYQTAASICQPVASPCRKSSNDAPAHVLRWSQEADRDECMPRPKGVADLGSFHLRRRCRRSGRTIGRITRWPRYRRAGRGTGALSESQRARGHSGGSRRQNVGTTASRRWSEPAEILAGAGVERQVVRMRASASRCCRGRGLRFAVLMRRWRPQFNARTAQIRCRVTEAEDSAS